MNESHVSISELSAAEFVVRCPLSVVRSPFIARRPWSNGRHAFSLVEVLLAIFILGIGLIMVATIFPVGADWTRQATEDTVAQAIAQDAYSVIQTRYGPNGDLRQYLSTVSGTTLQALPHLVGFPGACVSVTERAYQFGSSTPFPAPSSAFPAPGVSRCTYFWTALCRLSPSNVPVVGPTSNFDLYILVFRKGSAETTYNVVNEVGGIRDLSGANPELFIPGVVHTAYDPTYDPTTPKAVPVVGDIGIGISSGTVFRQTYDAIGNVIAPRPLLLGQASPTAVPAEQILYAPGPNPLVDPSPLIYVYQTTISQ